MYGKKTDESTSKMNHSSKVNTKYHQIELVSFGDCIPNGNFTIHSRFRRTINLHNNSLLISVVNEDIGKGPLKIIVRGLDFQNIHSLSVYNNVLMINNFVLVVHNNLKYCSKLSLQKGDKAVFSKKLELLHTTLLELCNEKSLCFLLDEKRVSNFISSFEKEFVKRMKLGLNLILKGTMNSLSEGIMQLKGCGFGLTPSGDDFIAGLLSGLYLKQEIFGKDFSETRKIIYETSLGENLISNSYLTLAQKGLFTENFKNFIHALVHEGKEKLNIYIRRMLNIGETSGADTLVGFCFAFEKAGELW